MPTLAQQWEARGLEKGREQGLEQGLEKGSQAQRQTLLRLLEWRFHPSDSQQAEYTRQMALIADLQLLTQLIDHLLAAPTLADFDERLATCLSATNDKTSK